MLDKNAKLDFRYVSILNNEQEYIKFDVYCTNGYVLFSKYYNKTKEWFFFDHKEHSEYVEVMNFLYTKWLREKKIKKNTQWVMFMYMVQKMIHQRM